MIVQFFKNLFKGNTASEVKQGKVKFFNYTKGFGFISISGTDDEIFVHTTNCVDKIKQNNKVTFQIEEGKKGPTAVNVKLVKS